MKTSIVSSTKSRLDFNSVWLYIFDLYMEKLLDTINFKYSDPEISALLADISDQKTGYSIRFNQNEDAFIECGKSFRVPTFPVHHNVQDIKPSEQYLNSLRTLTAVLINEFPDIFLSTRYFFDPAEILRPCFIQVFRVEESYYLYLFRPDFNIRISDSSIIRQSTNDATAEFETDKLYFESLFIPISKPDITTSGGQIPIKRLFRSTWVGESGTGYHINGQWIDRELTKMLSALYLPEGHKIYPYYPFRCDFNTVCFFPADISPRGRKNFLSYMHKALPLIEPSLPEIEEGIKNEQYSKTHPLYIKLKKNFTPEWTKIWTSLKIKPYLNENDMREYSLEYQFPK